MKKPKIGGRSNVRSRLRRTHKAPFEAIGWMMAEATKGNIVRMRSVVQTSNSLVYKISTKRELDTQHYLDNLSPHPLLDITEAHNEPLTRKEFLGGIYNVE